MGRANLAFAPAPGFSEQRAGAAKAQSPVGPTEGADR